MEHADHITSTIDAYLETNELPKEYKAGKIGGNPVMSIPDAESEI